MRSFPSLFWNQKKCLDFGKKGPDCVHLQVKFAIQNVVLRVSRRKTSKMFPCRVSFSCVFDECLLKCSISTNPLPPCPEKVLVVHLHSGIVPFAKRSILNVWQCSEDVCLDNCSVICIVTLYYVLHQTHLEFWHIQHFVFSGICWDVQSYSALLRHIHAYWDIIKPYSDFFRHIQHSVLPSHIHNLAIFWTLAYSEPKCSILDLWLGPEYTYLSISIH